MSQEELAAVAQVGVATVKRFESGKGVRVEMERSLRSALESQGVIIIEGGSTVEGYMVGAGVAVRAKAFTASVAGETSEAKAEERRRSRSV